MKKLFLAILVILVLVGGLAAWLVLGPATAFAGSKATLYISSKAASKQAVLDSIDRNNIVSNNGVFNFLANRLNYWQNIKPGRYDIEKGASVLSIVRKLRNGQQTPVQFTINKIRTKEDLARMAGNKFEFDSSSMINFLNNEDSLKKYGVDTVTAMTLVMPDTYTYFWNTTPDKVIQKMADHAKEYWTDERRQLAAAKGLTPVQAYILASIVEEETTNNAEKGNVASVYLNRITRGMPLQADPTVKFALRDFGLKRIYEKHLFVASPYNTYRNNGLPPGPICTPSQQTINAVLNAPATSYLYFVASPSFKQEHEFSETYEEHLQKAKRYQEALNQRAAKQSTTK